MAKRKPRNQVENDQIEQVDKVVTEAPKETKVVDKAPEVVATKPETVPAAETPKEEPKKAPVAKTTTKLGGNDFKSVMASVDGNKTLVHLVATLKRYVNKVFVTPVPEAEMAAMNYDLFKTILSVINTEDYTEFKAKFDLINRVFLVEKEGMFSPVTLNRNDLHWKHGSKNRFNYAILTEFISNMAHPGSRAKYAAKTNTEVITSFLSDKGSFNLIKYYKL